MELAEVEIPPNRGGAAEIFNAPRFDQNPTKSLPIGILLSEVWDFASIVPSTGRGLDPSFSLFRT
jgi:hypothetical protein